MKKYKNLKQFLKTVVLFITVSTLFCCNKDNNDCQGIECLPAATQTGAGTFGCLVNGEPYVDNSGNFNCFYQFVDGEYYFGIDLDFQKELRNLNLGTNSINFSSVSDIELSNNAVGKGEAIFLVNDGFYNISTSIIKPGFLKINFFNLSQNIISATFEFEVTDPNTGTVYYITNGRFDSTFTE